MLAAYHAIFAEGDIDDIKSESNTWTRFLDRWPLHSRASETSSSPAISATIPQPIRTIGTGSTLNGTGASISNLYDYLVPFDLAATTEMIAPDEVIDVRSEAASQKTFFDTVSDHLRLVARFRIDPDHD